MSKTKPSIPKGTRDFLPVEISRRNYIFDIIRETYQLHGFKPIETPAMENLTTLMGKYGEEGDRLIFKILNSGDFLSGLSEDTLKSKESSKIGNEICEKALRYDLTVPFARYIVQHQNDITFPFKRYQIQPVWRADRPQKGRYREFFQCDADIIGSNSMINEVELINIIDQVFKKLNINAIIKLNNRKILAGIIEVLGYSNMFTEFTTTIDKLEKIGLEKVNEELIKKGINEKAVNDLQPLLKLKSSNKEKIEYLETMLKNSETGLKGIEEVKEIFNMLEKFEIFNCVELDNTLARGLNYYTGTIIEVKSKDVKIGSICGGGRYDDLASIFGMDGMSGVGISFGADRIYDVMKAKELFPDNIETFSEVLFINFGKKEELFCLSFAKELRDKGIKCEIYPDKVKIKKQMQYADKNNIPFVVMAGEEEINSGKLTLKNMETGEQINVTKTELINHISFK